MNHRHYILDASGEPVQASLTEWARWFEDDDKRRVALTEFPWGRVSTVFLGLDHNYLGIGPPVLWETMIFVKGRRERGGVDGYQDRCSGSREQALAMHQRALELVKEQHANSQG